jgi:polynucleotide 5'-hydroxyl-kinase GRC3/NOL9
VDIPRAWAQLRVEQLQGVLLVIGAPDTGKSTLGRYLYERLRRATACVALLDGDPGQSSLGPPTTISVMIGSAGADLDANGGRILKRFVGAVSPRGHMLPLLSGAARLVEAARQAGAETVVYDSCGLVDPAYGGLALKLAKIDLLQPSAVLAIQRRDELESLLVPLRRSRRTRVIDLCPSPAVTKRGVPTRQAYRAAQYARHFGGGRTMEIDWRALAVFPAPRFDLHRLLAFEDRDGFVVALGIVIDRDADRRRVMVHTALASVDGVGALHLGDVLLDPQTFQDRPLAVGM